MGFNDVVSAVKDQQTLADSVSATVTSSGDTTILTPSTGKRLEVTFLSSMSDPTASTAPVIKVLLGTQELHRGYVIHHRCILLGAVDAPLKVNLSIAGTVTFSAHVK